MTLKNILNTVKNFFYAIPFAMKKADKTILNDCESLDNTITINAKKENKRLSEGLINGVVTEEVKELRYRDYKVYNESKKYKYIGDGKAEKINVEEFNFDNYTFSQENDLICESVYDTLNSIDKVSDDNYRIKIIQNELTRFKINTLAFKIDVDFKDKVAFITFNFLDYTNITNHILRSYVNNIRNAINTKNFNNEFFNTIPIINFVTYKATNEDDFIQYYFYNNEFISASFSNDILKMTYSTKDYVRKNLIDKFKNESLEEKYKNKEKKEVTFNLNKRVRVCAYCGKEMPLYDGDITEKTYGKAICIDCLKNNIIKK